MRKIGIELENESNSVSRQDVDEHLRGSDRWVVESDGSLRGGRYGWEIKTAGRGLELDRALNALNELYPVLYDSSGTWRAAVHVHVDANDFSWTQRALAICLAYVMDDSLFEITTPARRESNFCVPLAQKASDVFYSIESMLSGMIDEVGYGKYSSVNSNSLLQFGTIEFRHMQTPACGETVQDVLNALTAVRKFAEAAHAIVDAARYLNTPKVNDFEANRKELLRTFIVILNASDSLFAKHRLTPNRLAVLDVLTFLGGEYDRVGPCDIDMTTLASVLPNDFALRTLRRAPSEDGFTRRFHVIGRDGNERTVDLDLSDLDLDADTPISEMSQEDLDEIQLRIAEAEQELRERQDTMFYVHLGIEGGDE